jgi:RNA polymerase sigma factor (sigma-70 family)
MTGPRRTCAESGCAEPAAGFLFCRRHVVERHQAFLDQQVDERLDRKLFCSDLSGRAIGDDDWRADVVSRAVLPRRARLFGSEGATMVRVCPKEGARREYPVELPLDYYNEGLCPVEYRLAHVELKEGMEEALRSLTLREQVVIRLRFGIRGYAGTEDGEVEVDSDELTLGEVAEGLHLSLERVRQIEFKAMCQLRHSRLTQFMPWLEK